ncbi:MAG TPA: efflux RND transporter periplasmic adaptor subunit [Albitalea sp.]|nr:efflux RND transporter periplasmic adaptor subunit [Albitalea sp.]
MKTQDTHQAPGSRGQGSAGTRSKRRFWVGGTIALLVIAGAALALAPRMGNGSKGDDKKAAPPLEFTGAEVVRPVLVTMPVSVEFSGPLVAPRTAIVRAKAPGTLLSLNVAEGSRVKLGQVLGEIDLADLQSRVADRAASVEVAQAALAEAERQHTANVGLAAQNFIAATALQNSQAKLDSARAQLKSAQAQLASARVGLKEATLVAPISGVVAKRHIVPGEKVSNEQQVLTIVDLATLELAGSVGTHEVSRLAPGMPVQVRIEGQSADVTGQLARIAPAAEAGTRSIGVTIELANPKETFRAGQYAIAKVVLTDPTQRLTLPVSAIGNTSGQDHVWLIENGALLRRAVTTGRRDDGSGRVEVLQGVTPSNQVLAARFDNLHEGAKALVVARSAPVASASASSAVTSK